jgi:hypothetical protein
MSEESVSPFDVESLFLVEVISGKGKKRKIEGYAVCERIAFLPNLAAGKPDGDMVVLEKGSAIEPLLAFARLAFERNRAEGFCALNISNGFPKGGVIFSTGNQGPGNQGPPKRFGDGNQKPPHTGGDGNQKPPKKKPQGPKKRGPKGKPPTTYGDGNQGPPR